MPFFLISEGKIFTKLAWHMPFYWIVYTSTTLFTYKDRYNIANFTCILPVLESYPILLSILSYIVTHFHPFFQDKNLTFIKKSF